MLIADHLLCRHDVGNSTLLPAAPQVPALGCDREAGYLLLYNHRLPGPDLCVHCAADSTTPRRWAETPDSVDLSEYVLSLLNGSAMASERGIGDVRPVEWPEEYMAGDVARQVRGYAGDVARELHGHAAGAIGPGGREM